MIFPCVKPEFLLKICGFLHPLLAGYTFLGQEFIAFVNGELFHRPNDLILTFLYWFLAILISVNSGLLYLLQLAIKQRVRKKIRIYSFGYCVLFIVTNLLYSIKFWKNEQIKLTHWSVDFMIIFYYYNFTLQFIPIVEILNSLNQNDWNNHSSTLSKIGVRIFILLFCVYDWRNLYIQLTGEENYVYDAVYYASKITDICFIGWVSVAVLILISQYQKNVFYFKLYFYIKFTLFAIAGGSYLVWIRFRRIYEKTPVTINTRNGLLTHRLLYFFEIWLNLMFIKHLELENTIWNLENPKLDVEEGDITNDNFTEFNTLDKSTKAMIKKIIVSPLRFKLGGLIGEGNFGKVYKGSLRNLSSRESLTSTSIAVKVLKRGQVSYANDLISEIKSLLLVQKHPNLVSILGLTWIESRFSILMEYCSLGNLESYLREMKTVTNLNPNSAVYVLNFPGNITPNDLKQINQWALEIASAMEFIGTKKIVHADLATRNVLLDENKVAKLTDFGISIRLYNYQLYAKSKAQYLPWRWLAPEALSDMKFSSKSDVWAYGITLWEMYTFGDVPWKNFLCNADFINQLRNGLQLDKPDLISEDLYSNVMKQCWAVDENSRITFVEIIEYFKQMKPQKISEIAESSTTNL